MSTAEPNPAAVQTLVFQVMELHTYGYLDTFTIQVREGSICDFWAPEYVGGVECKPADKRPALKEFAAALRRTYDSLEGPLDPVQIRDAISEASKPLVATANEALAVDSLRIV
jgi:hypothetical protein